MCRWIEKVLSLGYGIAQSGDNSARHGEMAVPDFATKVMASTAYTSNQDSRSLEKERCQQLCCFKSLLSSMCGLSLNNGMNTNPRVTAGCSTQRH